MAIRIVLSRPIIIFPKGMEVGHAILHIFLDIGDELQMLTHMRPQWRREHSFMLEGILMLGVPLGRMIDGFDTCRIVNDYVYSVLSIRL